jgi:hypothetical protein
MENNESATEVDYGVLLRADQEVPKLADIPKGGEGMREPSQKPRNRESQLRQLFENV